MTDERRNAPMPMFKERMSWLPKSVALAMEEMGKRQACAAEAWAAHCILLHDPHRDAFKDIVRIVDWRECPSIERDPKTNTITWLFELPTFVCVLPDGYFDES